MVIVYMNPKQGDYPLILGDQAIYVIANNFKDEPIDSIFEYVPDPNDPSIIIDSIFKGISTPMQIEIHMMLYDLFQFYKRDIQLNLC